MIIHIMNYRNQNHAVAGTGPWVTGIGDAFDPIRCRRRQVSSQNIHFFFGNVNGTVLTRQRSEPTDSGLMRIIVVQFVALEKIFGSVQKTEIISSKSKYFLILRPSRLIVDSGVQERVIARVNRNCIPLIFGAGIIDIAQRSAFKKGFFIDRIYRFGNVDRSQRSAVVECISFNRSYGFWNSDRSQRSTTRKRAIANGSYRLRNIYRVQGSAGSECIDTNGGYGFRNINCC